MALTKNVFSVLKTIAQSNEKLNQRQLADRTDLSLGSVNSAVKTLEDQGLIDDSLITPKGLEALKPYEVKNAIIMAAGLSSRFAPISYEKPKGVLKVRGEVLIERQIHQLLEAGITDITVVVGYKKEYFFYLEEKYGVKIVVNPDYATRNNNSTLWYVKDQLDNTYICSSDDYFTQNPFEHYVYEAYYSATYVAGETDEWCLKEGRGGRITGVEIGGSNSWIMLGHVYFDRQFSKKFVDILEAVYDKPETVDMLWEEIYVRHIKELSMTIRKYPDGVIYEFDSLDELRQFDPAFIENIDSEIFDNIVSVLHCQKKDIHGFYPLKQGLTNLSAHFIVGYGDDAQEYVYRHPGVGTEKLVDRAAEEAGLRLARELGLDNTFIYEDQKEGWKISRYIDNARLLDYENEDQVKQALKMIRKLHTSNMKTNCTFDFWKEIKGFYTSIKEAQRDNFEGIDELKSLMAEVKNCVEKDKTENCLCHCDCYNPNFLLDDNDNMYLIDWEYSGMCDPAGDVGTFIACSPYTMDQADKVIEWYLAHIPSKEELRHFLGYVAIASYYWFVWSLYQDCVGKPVGEWQYLWYKSSKSNSII